MPKLPPPRETPPPRRRPPYITGYSAYQLRQSRSLRHRTVPNGEAAQALIGTRQEWSPRKGAWTTSSDVLDELADVIITAGIAMSRIAGGTRQAQASFRQRLAAVTARSGLTSPGNERHWTASAIVVHPDGNRVLLIDHVKSGLLLPPGGHVEPGEPLAEAVIREVREETGIEAEIIAGPVPSYPPVLTHPVPFAVIEARAADPVNGDHQHIDALYVCRAPSDLTGQVDQREVTSAMWASPDQMRGPRVPPELPAIAEAAIAWAARHATGLPARPCAAAGLVMVTSNPAKAATAADHLRPYGIGVEHVPMNLEEIQSASVEQVAMHKARQAYARLRCPVIVEDAGFFLDELGGFPGALAKPVTRMLGLDGLIRLAGSTSTRAAHFESTLAYIDPTCEKTFTSTGPAGTVAGQPAVRTRQEAWSVLWDIWIPPGASQPVSALSDDEYFAYLASWRGRSVFIQLGDWLRDREQAQR
jgi:XTP/dITP diphosphohydrolase